MGIYFLGKKQTHIPKLISLHGPRRMTIGLFQVTCTNSSSITVKVLSITVNYAYMPSIIIAIQMRHVLIMQALPSLISLLEK